MARGTWTTTTGPNYSMRMTSGTRRPQGTGRVRPRRPRPGCDTAEFPDRRTERAFDRKPGSCGQKLLGPLEPRPSHWGSLRGPSSSSWIALYGTTIRLPNRMCRSNPSLTSLYPRARLTPSREAASGTVLTNLGPKVSSLAAVLRLAFVSNGIYVKARPDLDMLPWSDACPSAVEAFPCPTALVFMDDSDSSDAALETSVFLAPRRRSWELAMSLLKDDFGPLPLRPTLTPLRDYLLVVTFSQGATRLLAS
jgi:hypothetical protein